ncbi:unnamed protein product [Pleuronectes platessa]|uniref:Uncharacterized protein n=1 Tax=Pleuronectes platessa TaxID=8262 RepID=A0A9N7UIW5_PLEPL|nr:unnamed protein product [Pleuronectes platessa]
MDNDVEPTTILLKKRWISCTVNFANLKAPAKRLFSSICGFITDKDTDILAPVLEGASVAILTILDEEADISHARDHAVVLEGGIVLHEMENLSSAFAYLFGLLYALNINYPKQLSPGFAQYLSAFKVIRDAFNDQEKKDLCRFISSSAFVRNVQQQWKM